MGNVMRPWARAVALVVLANTLFLLLALWVARLPREPLVERIRDAFASGELIDKDWLRFDSRRGLEQYLDCSVLQMISNRDDRLWANAVGPVIHNQNGGETRRCELLRALVHGGSTPDLAALMPRPSRTVDGVHSYRYTRYWHGYNPLAAALLSIFDLGQTRAALKTMAYVSLVLLALAPGPGHPGLLAVAGGIAVSAALFWALPYYGQSLTQGPADLVVILGLTALLFWRERLSSPARLVPFCAVFGAAVVYLEFLSGQLPTAGALLVPLIYLIVRGRSHPDNHPRAAWVLAFTGLLAFGIGALLTVALKQILAAVIIGPEALGTFLEYLRRYVNPSPAASAAHFHVTWAPPDSSLLWSTAKSLYVVLAAGDHLTYGSRPAALVVGQATALAWLIAGSLAFRARDNTPSDFLAFVAGVGVVVAWIVAFQTHTNIHAFRMVRMLIVPIALGWAALAWQLLMARGRRRGAAGTVSPATGSDDAG
jgi:hypothetical protein